MTLRRHHVLGALAALGVALGAAGPAAAQTTTEGKGSTSGPAVGGNVQPSATTQKGAAGHAGSDAAKAGNVSTGGVGIEAKKGSESGPTPNGKTPR